MLKVKKIKKGVWGIQREIENPISVQITGEENYGSPESKSNSIVYHIMEIYKEYLPDVVDNVKPDEVEFETIELSMRLSIDMGNKSEAYFLAALIPLYMLLHKRSKEMDAEVDYLFPLNYIVINKERIFV